MDSELIQQIRNDRFLMAFTISKAVALILPLIIFMIARATAPEYYENQNRDQEEQYDEYGNYIGQPHWWQFWKSSNNYNYEEGEEQREDERGAPWWCK